MVSDRVLGISDALLMLAHEAQFPLVNNQETRIIPLDFSAAFDTINHKGLIYRLQSAGVGGKALSILIEFSTSRKQ